MLRRHAAVAVVAVTLLTLLGTATPAVATISTDTTIDSTATPSTTTTANVTVTLATGGDRVVLGSAANQTVCGRTSLPVGTELALRVRSSGETPFLRTRPTTVSVRTADGDPLREYDAVIRSASTTATASSTTDDTSVRAPGFGAPAAVGAVAILVVVLARTRRTD